MTTNGDFWRAVAEQQGLPQTSIWKAQETLAQARKNKCHVEMARLMLRHGRLTEEARAYIAREYPQ